MELTLSNGNPLKFEPGLPSDYSGPILCGATSFQAKSNLAELVIQELHGEYYTIRFLIGKFLKKINAKGWIHSNGLYSYFMLKNGTRKRINTIGNLHIRQDQYACFYTESSDCSAVFEKTNEFRALDVFYSPKLLEELLPYFPELKSVLLSSSGIILPGKPCWSLPCMKEIINQILNCPYDEATRQFYFDLKVRELLYQLLETTFKKNPSQQYFTPFEIARIHEARDILESYISKKPPSIRSLARKVAEIYELSKEQKGTQIIFCDIGTPKPDQFNIYDALKEILLSDFNISSHHITFIHDWTDKQKPELFRKMNNGDIRILLGSTEKAGTGLNVQAKVVAMHHLDIPWKPSELEQRDGRGARQGNIVAKEFYNNKVKNFIYAVEQSLDNYKFNLLKNKQTFISQMKNCELNVRTIDEGSIDEKSGMNFSEYIAILSGDTTLLEKSKMEKKIAVLESLRNAHHKEVFRSRFKLENLQEEKGKVIQTLNKLLVDEKHYNGQLTYDKEGIKFNPVTIEGLIHADAEMIGTHLIGLYTGWKPQIGEDEYKKIGNLYNFNLYIRRQKETYEDKGLFEYKYSNVFYAESKQTGIKYSWNQWHINIDNPKLAARYFLNAIDRVESLKEKYQKSLQELEQNIPMLEKLVSKPFEKDEELAQLKKDVSRLEREITLKIQENQMKQHEAAEVAIEAPVVKMESNTATNNKSLLPKKKAEDAKIKGMRI